MDIILLEGIEIRTRIGITDDERSAPQLLLVTLEIHHPTKEVALSDNLSRGIDYDEVVKQVVAVSKEERKTVEKLAEDIAETILKEWKPSGGVKVTVKKTPPLPLESASVIITRP